MPEEEHENELQANQDGRVYPLGRALRATYGADNHDTLGSDVTGLMIDLSKVPYDRETTDPSQPALAEPPPRSWRDRLGLLWNSPRQQA